MPAWTYLTALIPGLLALGGLVWGGPWPWTVPVVVFGLVPILDRWVPRRGATPPPGPWALRLADVILACAVLIHLVAVVTLILRAPSLGPVDFAGNVLSVGILMGLYGLNAGHELGHRRGRLPRTMAKIAMGSALYAHFWIEHNRGHHVRVATPEDPASAPEGDVVQLFWVRSIVGGARSAWKLAPAWVGTAWVLQGMALAAVAVVGGVGAAAAWVGAAVVGILLLETVNYVEHYGLRRVRLPDGRWERVAPKHSWNAEHPVSRAMLFDLPRHADHHAHADRPCVALRPFEAAPELPAGYPEMILLALVPPWFHQRMEPELRRVRPG